MFFGGIYIFREGHAVLIKCYHLAVSSYVEDINLV
jgi:hypothetical protein